MVVLFCYVCNIRQNVYHKTNFNPNFLSFLNEIRYSIKRLIKFLGVDRSVGNVKIWTQFQILSMKLLIYTVGLC